MKSIKCIAGMRRMLLKFYKTVVSCKSTTVEIPKPMIRLTSVF